MQACWIQARLEVKKIVWQVDFVREDNIGSWVYVSSQFTRVLRRQVKWILLVKQRVCSVSTLQDPAQPNGALKPDEGRLVGGVVAAHVAFKASLGTPHHWTLRFSHRVCVCSYYPEASVYCSGARSWNELKIPETWRFKVIWMSWVREDSSWGLWEVQSMSIQAVCSRLEGTVLSHRVPNEESLVVLVANLVQLVLDTSYYQ
jgi:hypothetical protein